MKKLILLIVVLTLSFLSCSTESTQLFTLSTQSNPQEAGSVSPSGGEFDEGEEVTITATANEGWVFSGWQGDHTGSSSPSTIVMNSDKSVTAQFEVREYDLTLETVGEGSIQEQIIASKTESYPEGTTIELTAIPDEGWEFVEWSGDLDGGENPVQITVAEEMNITATFEPATAPAVAVTYLETGKSARLNTIQFLDDELGWIGGEGLLAKTTDGGETWTYQLEDEYFVNKLQMIDENRGFAVVNSFGDYTGTQGIYRTTDGGDNWALVYETDEEPRTLVFIDQNTGWVAGVNDLILKTSDGGDSWVVQDQFEGEFGGAESFWINDLFFLDENRGWGAGHYSPADNRLIVHTEDGGDTWEVVYDYMGSPFNFIHMFDENSGLTGSNRAIWRVSDGGENANEVFNHTVFSRVNQVLFTSESHGYVIGTNLENRPEDYFYETRDAGETWNAINTEDSVSGSAMDMGDEILWIASGPFVVRVEI
jgi:photosystem II stability/assembly factor-like uncharacterized protein